jgi:hypothetical protein
MVAQMNAEGFGACSAKCPKKISLINIARLQSAYSMVQLSS